MAEKISIDLLPIEFKADEIKKAKFYKIQILGVAVILLIIFLSSLTVALKILQTQNISQAEAKLDKIQQQVGGLKDTQSSLVILKDRLTAINQYLGVPSRQVQVYKLIYQLLPASVSVNSISIDKVGEVLVLATVSDASVIDQIINNMLSAEISEGKISQVKVETLSRGRDGIYRLSLKVKPNIKD